MLATATHDTKRGEDVRARLAVLSEMPEEWAGAVARWSRLTSRFRSGEYPDPSTEYFFYQTVVGAWPLDVERARAYMEKATREARTYTSWTAPDDNYDRAIRGYVEGALGDDAFVRDVEQFVEAVLTPGRVNALSQTLLKLTSPGVPDLYQGTEFWSLDLVDPDNRRPVDYERRRQALKLVERLTPAEIWRRRDEGLPKLWVTRQALAIRARHPDAVSAESTYEAISPRGSYAEHIVAFARGDRLVVAVPRLTRRLERGWSDTALPLPMGRWRNVLGDSEHLGEAPIDDVFADFPVALLERI
jgi:(1->4)-alpha-D-glucan 1-alpha-D-glucosylmutase